MFSQSCEVKTGVKLCQPDDYNDGLCGGKFFDFDFDFDLHKYSTMG